MDEQLINTVSSAQDIDPFLGATELARRITAQTYSSRSVVEHYLRRINRFNSTVNAVIRVDAERALEAADNADQDVNEGRATGAFHGVPVTLKDVHDTRGIETSHCHPRLRGRVPDSDGVVARRLREEGAIILGKTNFLHYPENPFGPPRNPWGRDIAIHGSSAGSAAAVSAGLSALDVGSDIGGSIVVPAAFCGIYAMRPTERRIPISPCPMDQIRLWRYVMTYGPLARTLEDVEAAVRCLAGPDEFDAEVPKMDWSVVSAPDRHELRVAWCHDFPKTFVSEDVANCLEEAIHRLSNEGVEVVFECPETPLWKCILTWSRLVYQLLLPCGNSHFQKQDQPAPLLRDFFLALEERDRIIKEWERFLSRYDVFMMPAFGTAPWRLEGEAPPNNASFAAPLSAATGHPSLVVPIGVSPDGLPIGAQLIGHRWQDERLLASARTLDPFLRGYQIPSGFDLAA